MPMALTHGNAESEATDRSTEGLHRPFFKAGIGIILTLGALWGVILLLRIGFLGSFTSVGIQEVNAHGHAQIFGWVGLFVMGFGYGLLPRLRKSPLVRPKLALLSCGLLVAGIVLRSGLQPMVNVMPALVYPALVGNALEIVAIVLFILEMLNVLRQSPLPKGGAEVFITAALGFFLFQAIVGAAYFAATVWAVDRDALLGLVALIQAPLRDLQIHGFAMLMIFGVSIWILPEWFGLRKISRKVAFWVSVLLIGGVIGEVVGFVLMRAVSYRFASIWGIAVLAMSAGSILFVLKCGVFGNHPVGDRSSKFLRAAYAWLLLSLAMLLLLPVWQFLALPAFAPESYAVEIGFSHAYYGAIRHAITVGFISLMILGVAARAVKERHGGEEINALWVPFILVNVGCVIRVGFQTLTDVSPTAFPIAGVSGLFELTGIAIWAVYLLRAMKRQVA